MSKFLPSVLGAAALALATSAQAVIVFNNASQGSANSTRGPGDSPIAAITVGSTQLLNQIGVSFDPNSSGNLKFVVFNLTTNTLLFSTPAVSFTDVGAGFYLSPIFSAVSLSPGITYGVGGIADVGGLWRFGTPSAPFTQGGFTALAGINGNVSNFANPFSAGNGAAQVIVQLGVVPEPASVALLAAGLGAVGAVAARRRRAG